MSLPETDRGAFDHLSPRFKQVVERLAEGFTFNPWGISVAHTSVRCTKTHFNLQSQFGLDHYKRVPSVKKARVLAQKVHDARDSDQYGTSAVVAAMIRANHSGLQELDLSYEDPLTVLVTTTLNLDMGEIEGDVDHNDSSAAQYGRLAKALHQIPSRNFVNERLKPTSSKKVI